jgi:mannose-6-phosphate isomerase-like protein (cupin superfamily)
MTTEFYTRERCFITELLNDPADPEVSLARCRVESGVTTELHKLRVSERYIIIEGQGLMRLGADQAFAVKVGDTVHIGADQPQQITNTGQTDLVFLCICSPRFTTECYYPLES